MDTSNASKGVTDRKSQSEFLCHLYTIPMVSAALGLISHIYAQAKSVWIFAKASDLMESSWKIAMGYADPLINQLSPIAAAPLHKVDHLAVKTLETLERNVPAIKKQPSEIVSDTKQLFNPAVERLSNVSETVLSSTPAQLSFDVMENILAKGTCLVDNVLPTDKAGFPHESRPTNKAARGPWLFKETFYFGMDTLQKLVMKAQSKGHSAANDSDGVANSVRKTL